MTLVPLVAPLSAADDPAAPTVVGTAGNEPLVRIANDGTIYVAALQHIYRSTDGGSTWTDISPSPYATLLNLNSDSSIALGPDGSTLWVAFDWPYAGETAACVTTTRGAAWTCNPVALPGVTDRMWIHALPDGNAVLITGEGLENVITMVTVVPGVPVFIPAPIQPVATILIQTGDFAQGYRGVDQDGVLTAPTNQHPWGLLRWSSAGSYAGTSPGGGFTNSAIPALARDGAGKLYGADDTGSRVSLVRNDGTLVSPSWSSFPVVTTGATRFATIAAGPSGQVAILFYWSPSNNGLWYAYKAVSTNANAATPTFTVTQLSTGIVHSGDICSTTACSGTNRYSGDFIGATYSGGGVPYYTWMEDYGHAATIMLAH